MSDGNPPRSPLAPYGKGVSMSYDPEAEASRPLILTDGTFHEPSQERARLRRMVLASKPIWEARDCLDHFGKVLACIDKAPARTARCRCCSGLRVVFQGKCSRRDCLLCKRNYPAKKAREYRTALGDMEWLGHYVATIPYEASQEVGPGASNDILKAVNEAIAECFHPVVPAGVSALHWTGEKDPTRPHVHVHACWSSKGELDGRLVDLPGPFLSEKKLDQLREATARALGVSEGSQNGNYSYRSSEEKIRHCLRYLTREQGCGDSSSLVRFTYPRAHTLKPFGMLGRGKRTTWVGMVSHDQEDLEMPGGSHPLSYRRQEESRCGCRSRVYDVIHQLD